jgi:hypothetical protein
MFDIIAPPSIIPRGFITNLCVFPLATSGTYSHQFLIRYRRDICGLIQRKQRRTQQQRTEERNEADHVKPVLRDSCELEAVSYSSSLEEKTDGNRSQVLGRGEASEFEEGASMQGLASSTAISVFDCVSDLCRANHAILLRSDRSGWLQTHESSLMAYCYTATGAAEKTRRGDHHNGNYSSAEIDREIITTFKV